MVVSALVQLAIAGPTGILFGLGYGTAIRVGYEIVYPALFGDKEVPKDTQSILNKIEQMYTSVGGLEAHKFGINQGIKNALKAIDSDPELVELIKKNSELGSQSITVNLSGTSTTTQLEGDSDQLSPPSVDIPPGLTMGIIAYVKALAEAAKLRKVQLYTELVSQIGLDDLKIFWLVKNGNVTQITAGHTIRIEFGLLNIETQRRYMLIHNKVNEFNLAKITKGGSQGTDTGGLTGNKQPIGVKWTKAAGQSQRLEKNKLIAQIRIQKQALLERTGRSLSLAQHALGLSQQSLVNLLARYRF